MAEESQKRYMAIGLEGYGDGKFVYITDPVEVWTPSGPREAPRIISARMMPSNSTMPQDIDSINKMPPGARRLTSGEWHQIRERIEKGNPETERSMTEIPYEATGTILDYAHGKKVERKSGSYFDGLVIQNPLTDGKGNFLEDEKGIIRAGDVWETALPLEGGYVTNMRARTFGKLIDTLYGTKGAINKLPDYSYLDLPDNPGHLINVLRGGWPKNDRSGARANIGGRWKPSDSDASVASRISLDGEIGHRLDKAARGELEHLLEEIDSLPIGEIGSHLEKITKAVSESIIIYSVKK
jgi:hypothetical protein